MAKRSKLIKFHELGQMAGVIEYSDPDAENKLRVFLDPKKDLVLELACGKGEYAVALAALEPEKQFVGIDYQGERLWYGVRQIEEQHLNNLIFLRTKAEFLEKYFLPHSISEIWITFPDPHPKDKRGHKRLISPHYLKLYKKILKRDHLIHLKTDSDLLIDKAIEAIDIVHGRVLLAMKNIDAFPDRPGILDMQTTFEKRHRSKGDTINYLKFKI
ncbi:TPA: tRNA (guanosine(46)-N7)-methyltransferase TrmB [Candidatus Falkowbacteria bacterium]|nr:tRNA (guanosine(46)-N7)-methyltransferase TrmB [Candidatus Falkowbacteria bacterium]